MVVNPRSMAQTVEHMFHLSFLVKENRAQLFTDAKNGTMAKAAARDVGEDNLTINEWKSQLTRNRFSTTSEEEVNAALADIEEKNKKFDRIWGGYCANYPLSPRPDPATQ